ncbi:phosphotransferase [Brachybacterium sp. AOP35-5H-19]|uniref:phosphotransferase n=1 Tax=Brachybacterium sp. AOP35-5H-19 TaxID=3457685 RepID=UPI004033B06A
MTSLPRTAPFLPPADLPVDLRRVELLCARLRPEEGFQLERIDWTIGRAPRGEGWDNALWPVGQLEGRPLVLRVARRESARALLGREVTVLRRLRGLGIPLPMGLPIILATADDAVLALWIDGSTADEAPQMIRELVAQDLARMLATIHSGPAPEVGRNPARGVPLAERITAFAADLDRADLPDAVRERAEVRWSTGLAAAPWEGRELLLHGDPHPGNVVVPLPGTGGRASLIDWGDTTRGDPASDLGGLLLHVPSTTVLEDYRETAAWTGIDDDAIWDALLSRAWAWGTRMALALVTAYPPTHSLGAAGHSLLSR